jgi:hypothetical protein
MSIPMHVAALPVPNSIPTPSAAPRPVASEGSGFGLTLAAAMSSASPENLKARPSGTANANASFSPRIDAKSDAMSGLPAETSVESKSSSTSTRGGGDIIPGVSSLILNPKSVGTSDAKSGKNAASSLGNSRVIPASSLDNKVFSPPEPIAAYALAALVPAPIVASPSLVAAPSFFTPALPSLSPASQLSAISGQSVADDAFRGAPAIASPQGQSGYGSTSVAKEGTQAVVSGAASNFADVLGTASPISSTSVNTLGNSPASIDVSQKSGEVASPAAPQTAWDIGPLLPNIPSQRFVAPSQPVGPPTVPISAAPTVSVSPLDALPSASLDLSSIAPNVSASLTPISSASETTIPTNADSSAYKVPVSPAIVDTVVSPGAESQFTQPIPANATTLTLEQPAMVKVHVESSEQINSVMLASEQPTRQKPSSVPNYSFTQSVASSATSFAGSQISLPAATLPNMLTAPASVSMQTQSLAPAQPVGPPSTSTLLPPTSDTSVAFLSPPPNSNQVVLPKIGAVADIGFTPGNSASGDYKAVNARPLSTTLVTPSATPAFGPGAPQLPAVEPLAASNATRVASVPESGPVIVNKMANKITNNSVNNIADNVAAQSPSSDSNSNNIANAPMLVLAASDAASNDMPSSITVPSTPAALSQTAASDKKSSSVVQPGVAPSPAPASTVNLANAASAQNGSLHVTSLATSAGKDASPEININTVTPSVPVAQGVVRSDAAPELPKPHQMLDSAPPSPPPAPPVPIAPGSAADVQLTTQVNAQMHLGVHSDAFGAVEIHTVVQQSQVGITVHSDRDVSRWFSSEIANLETGLNQHHLNLTAIEFDSGRSGVQTGTSFHNGGQPRQQFCPPPSSQFTASSTGPSQEKDAASESTSTHTIPSSPSAGPRESRVSIHV